MKNKQYKMIAGAGSDLMLSLFDAQEFSRSYQDLFENSPEEKDLFASYLRCASNASIRPNKWFDETEYRRKYRDVDQAIRKGEFLSGFQHWCAHGCAEGRDPVMPVLLLNLLPTALASLIRKNFEKERYEAQCGSRFETHEDAISHFLSVGVARAINPFKPEFFDESFYSSYYGDVRAAIEEKIVPCGLFHFLAKGFSEGRSGFNDKTALIKKKLGAAQAPSLDNLVSLEKKLADLDVIVDRRKKPRLNVFIPSLDGSIMFGGYIAFLHFLKMLSHHGMGIRFVVMEDMYLSKEWCLKTISNSDFRDLLEKSDFENMTSMRGQLRCSPMDINIAYSTWSALAARSVALRLQRKHIITFVQEYEPIFHEYSSNHFLSNSAYSIPQVAVFNSEALYRYFRQEKIGNFVDGVNSITFEHSLNVIPPTGLA